MTPEQKKIKDAYLESIKNQTRPEKFESGTEVIICNLLQEDNPDIFVRVKNEPRRRVVEEIWHPNAVRQIGETGTVGSYYWTMQGRGEWLSIYHWSGHSITVHESEIKIYKDFKKKVKKMKNRGIKSEIQSIQDWLK